MIVAEIAQVTEQFAPHLVTFAALKEAWGDGFDAGFNASNIRRFNSVNPYATLNGTQQEHQLERAWNQGYVTARHGNYSMGYNDGDAGDDDDCDFSAERTAARLAAWAETTI
jgi:hypothetical protein